MQYSKCAPVLKYRPVRKKTEKDRNTTDTLWLKCCTMHASLVSELGCTTDMNADTGTTSTLSKHMSSMHTNGTTAVDVWPSWHCMSREGYRHAAASRLRPAAWQLSCTGKQPAGRVPSWGRAASSCSPAVGAGVLPSLAASAIPSHSCTLPSQGALAHCAGSCAESIMRAAAQSPTCKAHGPTSQGWRHKPLGVSCGLASPLHRSHAASATVPGWSGC